MISWYYFEFWQISKQGKSVAWIMWHSNLHKMRRE